jgi:hypothetical protein
MHSLRRALQRNWDTTRRRFAPRRRSLRLVASCAWFRVDGRETAPSPPACLSGKSLCTQEARPNNLGRCGPSARWDRFATGLRAQGKPAASVENAAGQMVPAKFSTAPRRQVLKTCPTLTAPAKALCPHLPRRVGAARPQGGTGLQPVSGEGPAYLVPLKKNGGQFSLLPDRWRGFLSPCTRDRF